MSELRRRQQEKVTNNNEHAVDNDIPSSKKEISCLQAILGIIWFLFICISASILTDTYYECLVAFVIHYAIFTFHALPYQSEKYFDFTGMLAFISVDIFSFIYRGQSLKNIRNTILSLMILGWTLRLGLFLFRRIVQLHGSDSRFDEFKGKFFHFLMVWTLSAQWVFFCTLPISIVNKNEYDSNVYITDIIGWMLFIIGWSIEITADSQKTNFKAKPQNKGKFTNNGLWKFSRHPNYFGEIVLWIGIAISASSVVHHTADLLVFAAPFWTIVLLVFLSGIPPSEKAFKAKYKNVDGFEEYMNNTPVLIPFCVFWK